MNKPGEAAKFQASAVLQLDLGCRHRSRIRENSDFFRAPKSHDSGYILIPSCNAALGGVPHNWITINECRDQ